MNRINLAVLGALGALLLATGCATTVTGVRQDTSLTGASIIEGKMAVGGVFSNFEELTDKERSRHATNLRIAIQEEHEKYELTPMPEVRDRLGKEAYEKIMQVYAADGILGQEALAQIKAKIPERYLTLVRVEEDNKGQPQWSRTSDSQGRGFKGPGVGVYVGRTVKVTAIVYDLKDSKKVWDGLVTTRARSYVDYPQRKDASDLSNLLAAVSGQPQPGQKSIQELYPAPAAPALFEMFPEAFAGFAKSLPKK